MNEQGKSSPSRSKLFLTPLKLLCKSSICLILNRVLMKSQRLLETSFHGYLAMVISIFVPIVYSIAKVYRKLSFHQLISSHSVKTSTATIHNA